MFAKHEEGKMKRKIQKGVVLLVMLVTVTIGAESAGMRKVYADETYSRIHCLTVDDNALAILVESDGHFGMIDSGEDTDYPTGDDPRYPIRPGIIIDKGYEEEVIAYLKSVGVTQDNFDFYIGTHPHSDHIGSADEIIRAFTPKRV